jgi:D-3-phosphoglycerate dehydrogenase
LTQVLLTSPPMIGLVDNFREDFGSRGWNVVIPEFTQAMSEEALIACLPRFDGWIIGDDPATARVLEAGAVGKLRAAVKWGIGTDNIDFDAAERLGIPIANTPSMFGGEVADLAMHYLTGLARQTYAIDRAVRGGLWPQPAGISLAGKRVALVGYGDIGKAFARRAAAADLDITVYDPAVDDAHKVAPHRLARWPDRLESADFIVLACALTRSSRAMMNAETFARIKPGAMLVNIAHGGLIDEKALSDALWHGRLASAALDVFATEPLANESLLRTFPQCIFGSHNGCNTVEAVERASTKAINALGMFLGLTV